MNMKKLVLLLLTLTLVLVSTVALAEVHDNNCQLPDKLAEKNSTCSVRGWCRHEVPEGTPGAVWDAAAEKYFVEYEKEVIPHTFDKWVEKNPVTIPCQEQGHLVEVCSVCGAESGNEQWTEPKPHDWKTVVDVPGTCTEKMKGHLECKVCGARGEDVIGEIDPENHDWGSMWYDEGKEPTCCRIGYGYHICNRCKARQDLTTPQLPHNFTEKVVIVEPTCTTAGYYYLRCTNTDCCAACKADNTKHQCTVMDYVEHEIPALGHLPSQTPVTVIEPTGCLNEGLAVYYCERKLADGTVCGAELDEIVIPANGHTWGEWQERNPATGESYGYWLRTCAVCGETDTKISNDTPIVEEPPKKVGFDTVTGTLYNDDGTVSTKTGMFTYEGEKFFLKNGKVDKSVSGVQMPAEGTWYVFDKGWVVSSATGFITYGDQAFVCEGGALKTGYNGLYDYNGGKFVVTEGRWRKDLNGLHMVNGSWYFLREGMVQKVTDLVSYDGAIFYVRDGVLAEYFTGVVKDFNGTSFNVVNGMVK